MLALLRSGADADEPYEPMPGMQRLHDLVQQTTAAGVAVEVLVTGTERPLSRGVDACVYRVLQESLTNVIKHAAPARAWVIIHYGSSQVVLRVVDNGRRKPGDADPETIRHGIIGMRERARLHGGTLSAERLASGGFEVVLTVPDRKETDE